MRASEFDRIVRNHLMSRSRDEWGAVVWLHAPGEPPRRISVETILTAFYRFISLLVRRDADNCYTTEHADLWYLSATDEDCIREWVDEFVERHYGAKLG